MTGICTASRPPPSSRLPISDDELIERTIAMRDFLGIPAKQALFLTYDTGAAFRAQHAALISRLLPKTPAKSGAHAPTKP